MANKLIQFKNEADNIYPVSDVNFFRAKVTGGNYNFTTWGNTKLNITNDGTYGTKLTLSNNSIRIGKAVQYVRVSGIATLQTYQVALDVVVSIRRNNITVASAYGASSGEYWHCESVPANIIAVSEGDLIDIRIEGSANGTRQVLDGFLMVEIVN